MPINLAGGYAAGGLHDALLEIVKQRMLEQELAQRQEENQFQRLRADRLDKRQADQDTIAAEERKREAEKRRYDILNSGLPQADLNTNLGEDLSTAHVIPTTRNPNIPDAGVPSYTLPAVPIQSKMMSVEGVNVRPRSREMQLAEAEQAANEKAMNTGVSLSPNEVYGTPKSGIMMRGLSVPKPPNRSSVSGFISVRGLPVTQDEEGNFYEGTQKIPPTDVRRAPPQRDPGAADARDLARLDRSFYNAKATLDKARSPIAQQAERLDRVVTSINQNSPQADALIAPELLTAMAGGQGSGLRMNEAEISRIVGGRTNWESLKAAANKWYLDPSKGLSITPAQRLQIRALTTDMQKKVLGRLDALDRSDEELRSADSVEEHRRIVSEAQKALTDSARPDEAGGKVDVNSIINDVLSGKPPIKK